MVYTVQCVQFRSAEQNKEAEKVLGYVNRAACCENRDIVMLHEILHYLTPVHRIQAEKDCSLMRLKNDCSTIKHVALINDLLMLNVRV